jgi:hypothetical protein
VRKFSVVVFKERSDFVNGAKRSNRTHMARVPVQCGKNVRCDLCGEIYGHLTRSKASASLSVALLIRY